MKKICILTATRAEYGLLKNLIIRLSRESELDVKTVVTGMHLSHEFGDTYKEIEEDGICIDRKIPILTSNDSPAHISATMGQALIEFGKYFEETRPDMLLVLGDRYETMAVCLAAVNQRIPIAHLHGGEKTEGAVDDVLRHAISKLSFLHFTCTQEYRKRVIQLGENPERVFNVGSMGAENIFNEKYLTKEELEQSIDFKLGEEYCVVTFHPVTLEENSAKEQVVRLLDALVKFKYMKYIITKANADTGGRVVNQVLDEFGNDHLEQFLIVESLGMKRYLSALKYSRMMIGNSSSGILEAPVLQVPTINIGDRQKGRIRTESILDCQPMTEDIVDAMNKALNPEFQDKVKQQENIYGDGHTSEQIVEIIKRSLINNNIDLKKSFYDL